MQTATSRTQARVEQVLTKQGITTNRTAAPTNAYLNMGRWVADCPCNGAELAAPGEDLVCGSCGTISTVKFPRNRKTLEKVLAVREVVNQNWHPGEAVADLEADNIEHGIFPDDLKVD